MQITELLIALSFALTVLFAVVGLALGGLARADDTSALAAADRLFAVPVAPYAGFYF